MIQHSKFYCLIILVAVAWVGKYVIEFYSHNFPESNCPYQLQNHCRNNHFKSSDEFWKKKNNLKYSFKYASSYIMQWFLEIVTRFQFRNAIIDFHLVHSLTYNKCAWLLFFKYSLDEVVIIICITNFMH